MKLIVSFLLLFVALVSTGLVLAQDKVEVLTPEVKHGLQTMNPLSDKWERIPIPEDAQVFVIDVNGDAQPAVLFGSTPDKKEILFVPVNEYDQFMRSWLEEKNKDVTPVTPEVVK